MKMCETKKYVTGCIDCPFLDGGEQVQCECRLGASSTAVDEIVVALTSIEVNQPDDCPLLEGCVRVQLITR